MGDEQEKPERDRDAVSVMPARAIWAGAFVLLGVGAVTLAVLLWLFGAATAQDVVRIRIVQLAGAVVVGAGGAAGLLLAARRQRSTEQDLKIKIHVAEDARHDARERRVTELYNAAAEQLGSDKAPVRMAAMYTLERLGQDNPDHRQTVVKLLCAYLRMPFVHPNVALTQPGDTNQEEIEVRRTAQRILTDHLKPGRDESGEITSTRLWSGMHLDLTGAVLDEFDLVDGEVATARFDNAAFHGTSLFGGAVFYGHAGFSHAVFRGHTQFSGATFYRTAQFRGAAFHLPTTFTEVTFRGTAILTETIFHATIVLPGVSCPGRMLLTGARRRWDSDRSFDVWPDGCSLKPPKNEEEGQIDGLDGVWGWVVMADMPAQPDLRSLDEKPRRRSQAI